MYRFSETLSKLQFQKLIQYDIKTIKYQSENFGLRYDPSKLVKVNPKFRKTLQGEPRSYLVCIYKIGILYRPPIEKND